MVKCSIVMMSWARPENINQIVSKYQNYECVDEIIIWNNNSHFFVSDMGLSKVKTLNSNVDFGINTRFVGALLASNRCIITHDDDLLLSEANIRNLIYNFQVDYTRIYSYEGRIPQDGKYTCAPGPGRIENVKQPTEVDIVLTRSTCFDKMYAAEYCKLSDVLFYDVHTNLNGEDIVFSYLTTHLSGKKPLIIPIPDKEGYTELPALLDSKISTRTNFIERRTELVDRCKLILPKPNYPEPDKNKITLFGNGFYPCVYYQSSFAVNSSFKKLLVKDDSNGIKYLSCKTNENYDWTIFYIDLNVAVLDDYRFILKAFFRENPIVTDIEFNYLSNEKELSTDRRRVQIDTNFVSETNIKIGDVINCDKDTILTSIKFILYNKPNPCSELCITELSISKN